MSRNAARETIQRILFVSRETIDTLDVYVELLLAENQRQNLISKASEGEIWDRHILDSAQLLAHAGGSGGTWLDVGTGAGFPGIVTAALSRRHHVLAEPRRKRAEFLIDVSARLGMVDRVDVEQVNVERLNDRIFEVVSARAVGSVAMILERTRHLADASTTWLLHKGIAAADEVEAARRAWNADFTLLPSMTSSDASIVKITNFTGRSNS